MRCQCLRPGKQNDKQENEGPGRGDDVPSSGMPITLRIGFKSDTFQHDITPFVALQQIGRGGIYDRRPAA
jgi:hypothetical protein